MTTSKKQIASPKQFLSDTKLELKKVEWPTKAQVYRASVTILLIVSLYTAYVALLDSGLSQILLKLKGVG